MVSDFALSRRQFLITLALTIASSPMGALGDEDARSPTWSADDVDWDEVINAVIDRHNRHNAGVIQATASYEKGSPHWCMEKAMAAFLRPSH